jgi:hypothetical protein
MAVNLPYVYDYVTKLCRQQAKSYKIMRMNMFATGHRKYKRLMLGGGQAYDRSNDDRYDLLCKSWTDRALVYLHKEEFF